MTATHDYDTNLKLVAALDSTDVLVGESGGLSAVYDNAPSRVMRGCHHIETEHGSLYIDSEEFVQVLA